MSGISPACHTITPATPTTTMKLSRSGFRIDGRRPDRRASSCVSKSGTAAGTYGGGVTIAGRSGRFTDSVVIAEDAPAVRVVQPRDSAQAISSAPTKLEQLG